MSDSNGRGPGGEQYDDTDEPRHDLSSEYTGDDAEIAATSVDEYDQYQPLVDSHDGAESNESIADAASSDTAVPYDTDDANWQREWDAAYGGDTATTSGDAAADAPTNAADPVVEPTVIAPSSLRGPSHDAEAQASTLEQPPADATEPLMGEHDAAVNTSDGAVADGGVSEPVASSEAPTSDAATAETTTDTAPPPLVEPKRPSLSLRGSERPDLEDTAPFPGLGAGAAGAAGVGAGAAAATASMSATGHGAAGVDDRDTTAADSLGSRDTARQPEFEVDESATSAAEPTTQTAVAPTQRHDSIEVDTETAHAAATGTPIVLVETPQPPKRKGARGVGFAVVLLATVLFAALFAAAFFAVGYLFDRDFDAAQTLQELWLRPSYLLPVIVFFLAYWIVTLVVNRAGWWAHVLGAFIIALLAYAGHILGAFLESRGGWGDVGAIPGIDVSDLAQLILAPLSVLAFVIAREVPIWLGGIVSRRGRKVKQYNRDALEAYERENAEKIAAYERTRV